MYFQGYVAFKSASNADANRGEMMMFVDTSFTDQVWMQFTFMPRVIFALCYVLPADSLFFDLLPFSHIQEKIMVMEMAKGYVLMSDFSAHFDCFLQQLPEHYGMRG